jgi:hypothetical protein
MPGYVADHIREQEQEERERVEWEERYAQEEIPPWRDEEIITQEEYEEPREDQSNRIRGWS